MYSMPTNPHKFRINHHILDKIKFEVVDWIQVAQDMVHYGVLLNVVTKLNVP